MIRVAALAVGALTIVGCGDEPRGPGSPNPVRLLVDGADPCRIVFGDVPADPARDVEEVAVVTTPDGPVRVEVGRFDEGDERPPTVLEIDRIRVNIATTDDGVTASWDLPPTYVALETDALDEAEVRALLPQLVETATASGLAQVLVDAIDGAEVDYAGPASRFDVTVTYEDGTTSAFNGRGSSDAQLAATGVERPAGEEVDAETFAAVVERLLTGDGACGGVGAAPDVDDVVVTESDVGALVSVLPNRSDVIVGAVELRGTDTEGRFRATLSHPEAQLLRDALVPPS